MRSWKTHSFTILLTLFITIGLDQWTKVIARAHLAGKGVVEVIGDFFVLQLAYNPGSFLGMGGALGGVIKPLLLIGLPLVVVVIFVIYLFRHRELDLFHTILYASMLGGGIGNLYDRIFREGLVTDFLNVGIGDSFRTGIFNIADMPITFGAIYLIIVSFIKPHDKVGVAKVAEEKV